MRGSFCLRAASSVIARLNLLSRKRSITFQRGAVVQPGLGRQIVNLEVAGSNPVGPAIFPRWMLPVCCAMVSYSQEEIR